jgi:hypothetical protein
VAEDHLQALEQMYNSIEDVGEAKWLIDAWHDSLNTLIDSEMAASPIAQDIATRVDWMVISTNQRLMSTYPLLATPPASMQNGVNAIWRELQSAGYPIPLEKRQRQQLPHLHQPSQTQQQRQEESQEAKHDQDQNNTHHDNDEMADTAAQLLERVADNTSTKFQNSQFLELMRKLRDREVRVEGDKMVDVVVDVSETSTFTPTPTTSSHPQRTESARHPTTTTTSSSIPAIDPKILDHADTDFEMPVFGGMEEYASPSAR